MLTSRTMVLAIAATSCTAQISEPPAQIDLGTPAPERPQPTQPRPLHTDPIPYVAVEASGLYRCTLDDNGRVECIHPDFDESASPPGVPFSQLATAYVEWSGHTGWGCGIRAADSIAECWGPAHLVQQAAPQRPAIDIAMSGTSTCALLAEDDRVACWSSDGVPPSLDGTFVEIAGGIRGICGRRIDDSVVCIDASTPEGAQLQVTVTELHDDAEGPIGITDDGEVWLLGAHNTVSVLEAMPGPYRAFAYSNTDACGVRQTGTIACTPLVAPPVDLARDLVRWDDQWCVVDGTGAVLCWESPSSQ